MSQVVFDLPHAVEFVRARQAFLNRWLPDLVASRQLTSALDVGSGVGYFARYLADLGLRTTGLEGRPENVVEAARRHPDVEFRVCDLEQVDEAAVSPADLVLCLGFLYHVENPARVIRTLHAMTARILVVESVFAPDEAPVARVVEEPMTRDQALTHLALVVSRSCAVKLLYRAGFTFVYETLELPDHDEFRASTGRWARRSWLVAAKESVPLPGLRLVADAPYADPWQKPWSRYAAAAGRLLRHS